MECPILSLATPSLKREIVVDNTHTGLSLSNRLTVHSDGCDNLILEAFSCLKWVRSGWQLAEGRRVTFSGRIQESRMKVRYCNVAVS
jgi:hypothetical protein